MSKTNYYYHLFTKRLLDDAIKKIKKELQNLIFKYLKINKSTVF